MSDAIARRRRWPIRILRSRWTHAMLVGFAVASPELYAWYHFRAARAALVDDFPERARHHLGRCRGIWPWDERSDVHLMSSRAAWRTGDLPTAMSEVQTARRIAGVTTADLAFEWALIQAADGSVAEVAVYLQQQAEVDPSRQRAVWEALSYGFLAVYRANDAYAISQQWLILFPGDTLGLEVRGRSAIQGRGRGLQLGSEDLQEVLRRRPDRTKARVVLSGALLDLGKFGEAIPELERLIQDEPDEPEHRVRLARSLKMMDRSEEAIAQLEQVLMAHPDHGSAVRTRGQFALGEQKLDDAVIWLSRAAELLPNDYQSQYLYYQVLQQTGQISGASQQLARTEEVKKRAAQLSDLRTRKVAERPLDPGIYTEMGSLLLKTGNLEQGLRWLDVALSLDPSFQPAHDALASHFESVGDRDRAAFHRRLSTNPR